LKNFFKLNPPFSFTARYVPKYKCRDVSSLKTFHLASISSPEEPGEAFSWYLLSVGNLISIVKVTF